MEKENTNRLIKKFNLFYQTITETCRQIDTLEDRQIYIKTIIRDCEKICETAELFEEYEIDENFLRKVNLDVDTNFYWLVNDDVYGPDNVINRVMEGKPSYMSFELNKLLESSSNFKIDGIKKIQMHLEFESERGHVNNEEDKYYENNVNAEGVERIKILSSLTDVVRIIEAKKKAGIISIKTEVKQVAQMFHTEAAERNSFEKKYNATKNRLEKEKSSSNSEPLVEFVKVLCEDSFRHKENEIEEIIKHLERVQKNII